MVKKSKRRQNHVSKAVMSWSWSVWILSHLLWARCSDVTTVCACYPQPRCHSTGGTLWTSRVSWRRRRSWSGTPSVTTARRNSCPASSWPTDMSVSKVHIRDNVIRYRSNIFLWCDQISSAYFFLRLKVCNWLPFFCFHNMYCAADFHREIVSEMGELGVLGPTIKGKQKQNHLLLNAFFKISMSHFIDDFVRSYHCL